MQPFGSVSEPRIFLFEKDINAGKEDRSAVALVGLVERERQIQRQHEQIVARLAQCCDQRVIPQAAAAEHPAGTRCDLNDVHPGARITGAEESSNSGSPAWG